MQCYHAERPHNLYSLKGMAKVETLDRENAELLMLQQEACGKFNGIFKESAQQLAIIAELEDKLQQRAISTDR
jgi:hypothetical protein